MPLIAAEGMRIAYDGSTVVHDVDLQIEEGSFTVLLGPNGSGKSTVLKGLAGGIRLAAGRALLSGRTVAKIRPRALARELTLLPQSPIAPPSTTVAELVSRGRAPYQGILQQRSSADDRAVERALEATAMTALAGRAVDALSGGQRQRAWIAMALAQETPAIMLDEPTTYLDLAHQVEILDLCRDLHQAGRTLVLVLHDLNLAARYATHLFVFREGRVVAAGPPSEVLSETLVREAFDLDCRVLPDPVTGTPLIVPGPLRASRAAAGRVPHPRQME